MPDNDGLPNEFKKGSNQSAILSTREFASTDAQRPIGPRWPAQLRRLRGVREPQCRRLQLGYSSAIRVDILNSSELRPEGGHADYYGDIRTPTRTCTSATTPSPWAQLRPGV